jgi:hypothetical protein
MSAFRNSVLLGTAAALLAFWQHRANAQAPADPTVYVEGSGFENHGGTGGHSGHGGHGGRGGSGGWGQGGMSGSGGMPGVGGSR